MIDARNLRRAGLIGLGAQLTMVIAGHFVPFIAANVFALGGTAISGIAGLLYAHGAKAGYGAGALGGAIVGGLCALIGIAVSFALGDVPAFVLAAGTGASTVAGAIGGLLGAFIARRRA